MRKKRIHIGTYGPCGLLLADALKFIRDWKGPGRVPALTEADLCNLIRVAVDQFAMMPRGMTKQDGTLPSPIDPLAFAVPYAQGPDATLALITHLRKCWAKDSKQNRIQNWLSTANLYRRERERLPQCWEPEFLSNDELVWAFIEERGDGSATAGDMEAARREYAKRVAESDTLSRADILRKPRKA